MQFVNKYKTELILLLTLIAGYFILRLPNLTLQPIFADEAIYIRWAQVMKAEPTLRFVSLTDGKTPLFMWLLIPLFKVFKDPLYAGRFLSVISGFFTLIGVYLLSKKVFSKNTAIWAAFFYVITPYAVFFDRMALVDSMLSAFTIWSIYFALWLIRSLRLDLAMILGYVLGGAILTKTPALINILVLPISLLSLRRNNQGKYPILRALIFLGISILIAFAIYNLLRLGPGFQSLSARNADYVFSPLELIGHPYFSRSILDPFIPHFHDISDWFPRFFTIPILMLVILGIYFLLFTLNRMGLVILIWTLIPFLLYMAFLKTFTARYLLLSVAPFLIFAGYGITRILPKTNIHMKAKIMIALIAVLPLALKFDYQLIFSPPPADLPKEERIGYFEDWTAGYGFKTMAEYLIEQKKYGDVIVGTAGFFGTLPDGLQIYLDKARIGIVGSTATISAQVRTAAKNHLTFFVGNKKDLEGKVKNVKLIFEFAKAKSSEAAVPDASVLYQLFPQ